MDCKEFELRIPSFLEDDMTDRELQKFLEHVETCEECMEELSIQILVLEGMSRLEDGNAFDLQQEIDRRIEQAHRRIHMHKTMRYVKNTLQVIALFAIILIIILFFV